MAVNRDEEDEEEGQDALLSINAQRWYFEERRPSPLIATMVKPALHVFSYRRNNAQGDGKTKSIAR